MIALETNVLLRLLLRDAPAQATAAQRAIESAEAAGDTVLINDLVLAEPVWTLASRYGIDKPGVLLSLQTLLDTGTFVFESRTTLLQAAAQLPTSSDDELGNKNWGLGPTAPCCTSTMAVRGSTACSSTTSGRCRATGRAAATTTA